MRDIVQSTAEFESWLRTQISLRDDHLQAKHDKMAEQPFEFFRATFYRWCERWNDACTEWARAEAVVAVGDLHIQNFGSWRAEEKIPRQLATLLREALPSEAVIEFKEMKPGVTKGLGSLGHDRFFSYAEHQGGPMAAEGKSVALLAAVWANGQTKGEFQMEKLLRAEARPFSPGTMIRNGWLIRPLMSDCGRIDLSLLNVDEDPTAVNLDQDRLLTAMGFEVANLHLLSAPADRLKKAISEFRIPTFRKTTETMIDLLGTDYKAWRKHWRDARGRSTIPADQKSIG